MKIRTIILCSLTTLGTFCAVEAARAGLSYTGAALSYTQDFDSLGTGTVTWTDDSTLAGWYLNSTVMGIPASLPASVGGNSTPNAYNVGVAGVNPATDRALAWLNGSTVGMSFIGLQLQNNSGVDYVGDVVLSLTLEQWSARNTVAQTVYLDYNANLVPGGNQLTVSGWTQLASFTGLNTTTVGAIDGNAAGNNGILGATITFTEESPWVDGTYLWFRIRDEDHVPGNDNMFAVDNASLTIAAIPEPGTTALWIMAALLGAYWNCRRIRLN